MKLQMMSLRLAFLSIVYSSEDGSQQRLLRTSVRSVNDILPERADEISPDARLEDTCKHDFECGFETECDGGNKEVRRGSDMEDKDEDITDDIDYSGLIQLEVGDSAAGFPWNDLRIELDKFSSHLKLIVIALQFKSAAAVSVNGNDLNAFINRDFRMLAEKKGAKSALYVFAEDLVKFEKISLTLDTFNCAQPGTAVQISLEKKIRGPNDSTESDRTMYLNFVSANLQDEERNADGQKECLDQLIRNAYIRCSKDEPKCNTNNAKVTVLGYFPGKTQSTNGRRLSLVRPGRDLVALQQYRLRRRLRTASFNKPACLTENELAAFATLQENQVKVGESLSVNGSKVYLIEGNQQKNSPTAKSFTSPSGRTYQHGEKIIRCFDNTQHPAQTGRIIHALPNKRNIYSVKVKSLEVVDLYYKRSHLRASSISLPLVEIASFGIFEGPLNEEGNEPDFTVVRSRENPRTGENARWVHDQGGWKLFEGALYVGKNGHEFPVCDNGMDGETEESIQRRKNLGKVVCSYFDANAALVKAEGATNFDFSETTYEYNCNGTEKKLSECQKEETSCSKDRGDTLLITCYWRPKSAPGPVPKLPEEHVVINSSHLHSGRFTHTRAHEVISQYLGDQTANKFLTTVNHGLDYLKELFTKDTTTDDMKSEE